MSDILYIVIPCYNEEAVLSETSSRLKDKLLNMIEENIVDENSRILFVDDGSKDHTWELIASLHDSNPIFSGVKLSRNSGHQNALLAGLATAMSLSDVTISIDADLQDDIECLKEFIFKYKNGCDIVFGVRKSRDKDTIFKRTSAQGFYKIMQFLGVRLIYNHADYRLMSRRALEGLSLFNEVNIFLRGIIPLIGYKTGIIVEYERGVRFAGESKYPLKKMIAFAFDGLTSFSVKPIRLITIMGFTAFFISLCLIGYSFINTITGKTVPGWSSTMVSIWFLGGLHLLALGIIGEYIGKIYSETKSRPRYIIEKVLDNSRDR